MEQIDITKYVNVLKTTMSGRMFPSEELAKFLELAEKINEIIRFLNKDK